MVQFAAAMRLTSLQRMMRKGDWKPEAGGWREGLRAKATSVGTEGERSLSRRLRDGVIVPAGTSIALRIETAGSSAVPPQYTLQVIGDPFAISPLVDGRFTFSVPKTLGECPDKSLVQRDAKGKLTADSAQDTLAVKGSDSVYIGFRYTDGSNTETWVTEKVVKTGDAMLDVMDRAYRNAITATHVGEKVYLRLVDKTRDTTATKDAVPVLLRTSSGHTVTNQLVETQEHTGIFKGVSTPLVDKAVGPGDADYFPCRYGDTVTVAYASSPAETITQAFAIHRGADGRVQPFTKRFRDPQIAIKTQFAVAEAHFEQAKNHRQLNRQDLAKDEIANGRRVLKEAIRDFPDFDFHDHAEYLLANLAMELAGDEKDQEARDQFYREAIGKFSQIVVQYPESEFAPRAQYKKALCYEKLLYMDQACEEYVKLSYQYPEHELIAETIAHPDQALQNLLQAADDIGQTLTDVFNAAIIETAEQFLDEVVEALVEIGQACLDILVAGRAVSAAATLAPNPAPARPT
ncbi:MAG: hypothetical protein HGA75_18865 [Thiobacillus sp.]|nr:hypothetical protein [Thiobacillus sp.]